MMQRPRTWLKCTSPISQNMMERDLSITHNSDQNSEQRFPEVARGNGSGKAVNMLHMKSSDEHHAVHFEVYNRN